MANAHDLFVRSQFPFNVGIDLFFVADFLQHVDHSFVRAAVQRALQRADGRGNRRVEVAQRRNSHARAEGRCIHAVLGVKHERQIEDIGCFFRGLLAVHQIEKMRRLAQVLADRRQRLAISGPVKVSRDHAYFRRDAAGSFLAFLKSCLFTNVWIVKPEHRHCCAHHIHRRRILRCRLNEIDNAGRQRPLAAQLFCAKIEFRAIRQFDLFVTDSASQLVDVVSAVNQLSFVANNGTQACRVCNDALQAA